MNLRKSIKKIRHTKVRNKHCVVCPNCGKEINYFNAECEAICYARFELSESGRFVERTTDWCENGPYEYKCPECDAHITSNSAEASALLRGEKAFRAFIAGKDKSQLKLGVVA